MTGIKLFLPSLEIFNRNWGKSSEFGSFENLNFFTVLVFFSLIGSSFDEVLMYPASCFFDDIKDDRFLLAVQQYLIYFFDDMVDIVSGDSCDGFDFVLEGGDGVLFGEFKHDVDLVLGLVAFVGFAEDVELVGCGFFDQLKFVEVDVGKSGELVTLVPQDLDLHTTNKCDYNNNMAFVSQTDRGITKFPNNNTRIGPGSYPTNEGQSEKKFNYAPFCSTSMRELIGEKMQLPGPGAYSIKGQIGEPAFTTYSTKKQIIIKVNTTGTNSFLSRQQRFSQSEQARPGPGSYKLQQNLAKRLKTTLPARKRIVQPIKQGPSILTPKHLLMNEARAKTVEAMRKLKYEMKKQSNSVKSVWARDRINRFKVKYDNEVGPGKYSFSQQQANKQRKLSAGFASNTVRSVFDTIMFDTKNQDTLDFRKKKGFKTDGPAPGVYFSEEKGQNEALKYKNRSFGSTIERFSFNSTSNDAPFYNTNAYGEKISSKKMPAFGSQQKRCFTVENQTDNPGPASYHPEEIKIGKILKIEFGAFGTHVQRKIFESKMNETIGPGHYEPFRCKTQQMKPNSVFNSVIPRKTAEQIAKDQKFGVYDVSQNDISRRALQNRQHRQNLKRIDCQKPPFDTQNPRFKHYDERYEQDQVPARISSKQRQIAYLSIKQKQKSKVIQSLKNQVPKNISTISKSRRFDDPKKGPGVGDYAIRNKWVQKSYNIKYNANKQ